MKTFLKLISVMSVVFFTSFAFAAAAGDDPNMVIHTNSQAGTMMPGSDLESQVPVCLKCQHRNKLKLSDNKDHAKPGKSSEASGSGSANKVESGQ